MTKLLLPIGALALLGLIQPILGWPKSGLREHPSESISLDWQARSMASLMPQDSVLYLDAPGLAPLWEQGLEHPLVNNLVRSELGSKLLQNGGTSLDQKLKFIDTLFGEPVLAALQQLSSQGAGVSLSLRSGKPALLVALHGTTGKDSSRILRRGFRLLEDKGFDASPKLLGNADLWNLKDEAVLVQLGSLVLFASTKALAEEALQLALQVPPVGLASNPDFAQSIAEASPQSAFRGWIDSRALAGIDPKKFEWMELLQHTPQGQLLLGSGLSELFGADSLGMELKLAAGDIEWQLWGQGLQWEAPLGPQTTGVQGSAPPALQLEGALGQALLYRDLPTFFAERPNFLRPRDLPGVSEALTNISLFFGGLDFGEEVSPDLSPWVQLLSAELDYERGPTPDLRLPGLALVCELRDPESSSQRWNAAFQSIIGLINIDAAQKQGGRGSLLLGLSLEGETVLSHASYPTPAAGQPVDVRYNLRPTCCVVDGRLVIGTHEDLVRRVVQSLKAERANPGQGPASLQETLHLQAAPIRRSIQDNFETLVMNKVLDDGVSFEKATEEIEGIALALKAIQELRIEVDYGKPDCMRAKLLLSLRTPEGPRSGGDPK